jgi:hypothetical protein
MPHCIGLQSVSTKLGDRAVGGSHLHAALAPAGLLLADGPHVVGGLTHRQLLPQVHAIAAAALQLQRQCCVLPLQRVYGNSC